MNLYKNYKPNIFSINTKKHGIVEFSYLSVWRMTLIIENTKNIKDIETSDFCLIVAKYLIFKKENIVYDEEYYKKIKSYNNIKLILEKEELDNFSKEFVLIYKSDISNYIDIDGNDELDNHKIIKMYFFNINEEFVKLVEKTTKFTKLIFDNKLFDQVKKISELTKITFPKISSEEIKKITEAAKVFSGIPPSELKKLSEAAKINFPKFSSGELESITKAAKAFSSITPSELERLSETAKAATNVFPLDKIMENNKKEEQLQKALNIDISQSLPAPIIPHNYELEVLCDIKDLFNSFKTDFDYFKEYIKSMLEGANTIINNIKDSLELQIDKNAKTSKIAFWLSITAIIIAGLVGGFQIFFSQKSNIHIEKMNSNIEQLNNTIIELNTANKNYLDKIGVLTNELILLKGNKNQIEDKNED